jgi:hypothetical protein
MLRAITEQQREFTRYRIRQEVASIARSRERRSPPSEPENHRRTRPRHASFAPTSYISPPNPPRAPAATTQPPPGPGLSMNSSLRQRVMHPAPGPTATSADQYAIPFAQSLTSSVLPQMGGQGPGPFNGRFLPPTQLPPQSCADAGHGLTRHVHLRSSSSGSDSELHLWAISPEFESEPIPAGSVLQPKLDASLLIPTGA